MLLQPFLVWVLTFVILDLDPLWGMVAVLAAGMPIGINTFLFAQHNQADTRTISTAILMSSVFAVVSQSAMIYLFLNHI
jgi:predicted permease